MSYPQDVLSSGRPIPRMSYPQDVYPQDALSPGCPFPGSPIPRRSYPQDVYPQDALSPGCPFPGSPIPRRSYPQDVLSPGCPITGPFPYLLDYKQSSFTGKVSWESYSTIHCFYQWKYLGNFLLLKKINNLLIYSYMRPLRMASLTLSHS